VVKTIIEDNGEKVKAFMKIRAVSFLKGAAKNSPFSFSSGVFCDNACVFVWIVLICIYLSFRLVVFG